MMSNLNDGDYTVAALLEKRKEILAERETLLNTLARNDLEDSIVGTAVHRQYDTALTLNLARLQTAQWWEAKLARRAAELEAKADTWQTSSEEWRDQANKWLKQLNEVKRALIRECEEQYQEEK